MVRQIHADDLIYVLTLARLGRLTAASDVLGVSHTTVSRRVAELEKALGARVLVRTSDGWELTDLGRRVVTEAEAVERAVKRLETPLEVSGVVRVATPDGFGTHAAVAAALELGTQYPELHVELLTATRRQKLHRSGFDIEVVIGRPVRTSRARAVHLCDYRLGLFASEEYLSAHPTIRCIGDLSEHRVIYYVQSTLEVDQLGEAISMLPQLRQTFRSTSVHAHVRATALGLGVGILPVYMAEEEECLVRVLASHYECPQSYWAVVREEAARNLSVRATLQALATAAAGLTGAGRTGAPADETHGGA